MKLILALPVLIFIPFFTFVFFSCSDSSTEINNSVESINVSVRNDTLSVDINVENMVSNAVNGSVTHFSKDSVDVSIMVSKLSSGNGLFFLISGQIVPDTTFKGLLDSVTAVPKTFKVRMNPSSNSFSLVLKNFTGQGSILVTSKK